MDCSRSYGNNGCNGGYAWAVLNYIQDQGTMKREDYPYTGQGLDQCNYDREKSIKGIKAYEVIKDDVEKIKISLQRGPV